MPLRWTSSSHFIPARNSRHRTACFALYRALLRLAPLVPLPPEVQTGFHTKVDPITNLIRRAFKRNRADTSPRLVNPALKAGYRFLTLLSRAVEPTTPEHEQVVDYLESRLAARQCQIETEAPPYSRNPRNPNFAPFPAVPPLLVKISPEPSPENPHPKPEYAIPSRPVPLSELPPGARRRVPRLDMAAEFPILRIKKPQPNMLNRILTRKSRRRVARVGSIKVFYDEALPDAVEEDRWEHLVHELIEQETLPRQTSGLPQDEEMADKELDAYAMDTEQDITYEKGVMKHGIAYLNQVLQWEREDQVARADAMYALIKEEAALATKEKEERNAERRRKWEERMHAEHGEGWEEIIKEEKKARDEARAKRINAARAPVSAKERQDEPEEVMVDRRKERE